MPISTSRAAASGASFVCSVVSTRWPVRADSTAICAVSRSRTSPTMMMSGSARTIERRPAAKVSPVRGADRGLEAFADVLLHAEVFEVHDHRLLVEDAHHYRLAAHDRQRR